MINVTCPRCGEETITIRVYQDVEGDSDVINGTHVFWTGEIDSQNCGCDLTDAEEDQLIDHAVTEALVNDDEPGEPDDLEDYLLERLEAEDAADR